MERSNREIALQYALNYTRGTVSDEIVDDPMMGRSNKYIDPTIEQQLQNAEKYLTFLEGDEVA